MNLLLDTHVLIWAESEDSQLGEVTRQLVLDASNSLLVSPVSSLEIARLISLERLHFSKSLNEWLKESRLHLDFNDAEFTHSIAIRSYDLPDGFHKDPADRMLVATAIELDCHLLTADDLILRYPHVKSIDARR
jgi:PIN domain nuclease of toxin-antitoxin system